jgi:hypothetical protein
MATALTQSQLIQYAGKRAGNESLATFAADWLNNIIDTLAQNYKFPELEKTTTGTLTGHGTTTPSTLDTISLPADFGDLFDVHSLVLIDSNGTRNTLTPQTTDWFDNISSPLILGQPNSAIFDLDAKTWTPFPLPELTYTWRIRYRAKPSRLSSDTTIPFASDDIFIQALYVQILQYEDDQRYPQEYGVLQSMIGRYLAGYNKSPIKSKSMRLNADAFRNIQNQR